MLRPILAALAFAAATSSAQAGGYGCAGDCYRQVYVPPTYGMAVERTPVRAPRTYALVTEPEYRTVYETVAVEPARRIWTVRRAEWGRKVGCWVEVPARYATLPRRVVVRAPEVVPYAQASAWGLRSYPVEVEPARRAWYPVGEGR